MVRNGTQEETVSNLQLIRYIGPSVARRLQEAGIPDAAALARATPEHIEAALEGMPVVSHDRVREWIETATRMSPQAAAAIGQRYATFKLELLLNDHEQVRRTRMSHVQSGQDSSWAGWEAARLSTFVAECAGIPRLTEVAASLPAGDAPAEAAESAPEEMLVLLQLHDVTVTELGESRSRHMIPHGRPFSVAFVADKSAGSLGEDETAPARATLYAHDLPGGWRHALGEFETTLRPGGDTTVQVGPIGSADLSPGAYRLEVELTLEAAALRPSSTATLREGLLVVC